MRPRISYFNSIAINTLKSDSSIGIIASLYEVYMKSAITSASIRSKYLLTALLLAGLLISPAFAGPGPDYNCEKSYSQCQASCDNSADTSKNAKAYQKCLDQCEKANRSCEQRQEKATACAESFQSCISEAAGDEKAMEGCRKAYRSCKGD